MTSFLPSLLLLFLLRSIRAQDYDDRAQNQWWSDYSSLDDYDDDDLDRHMNLIITKNILPGDAPLPFDEALFYRRQPSSSEEFDFSPPPPLPRRKSPNKKNLIVSSTLPPPPPPPPTETFRPRPSPKPSRKPIFRPALTRPPPPPPTPPPIDDDVLEEDIEEEAAVPSFVRSDSLQQPAVLSDSQNVFVTRGTESPKTRNDFNPNRFPVSFSEPPQVQPESRPQPQPQPQLQSRPRPRPQPPQQQQPQTRPQFQTRPQPPPQRPQTRPSFVSSSPVPPVSIFPSTFRPRQTDFSLDAGPPPSSFPPNSAVFIPPAPESFTSRPSPITRQSIAPLDFFSSPTTASFSTFEQQTPQGRRTQVLKRRFRPSTQLPDETPDQLQSRAFATATFPPSPSPLPSSPNEIRSERRRVRINADLNNFSARSTSSSLEPIVGVSKRNRVSTLTVFEPSFSSALPQPSTVGRLLEPQRIPTTFRPSTVGGGVKKKEVIRKKVPASSSSISPQSNSVSVSPFVRRRPVITTPTPTFALPPAPSPDVEVRGRVRVPVTTSIPQLFLSTPSPISAQHTPISGGEISSNTEIISPADLREVARQQQREHSNVAASFRSQRSERSSTRFQRDETRRQNAILASANLEFGESNAVIADKDVNLTETPSCYDGRASFCTYDQEYPRELVDELVRQRETELKQLFLHLGIRNETQRVSERGNEGDKFVCESVTRIVRPGWAKDALSGKWLVVVNSKDARFQQNIRIESCTRQNEPCHFISPYYRSSCVERENLRRLVAVNPRDQELRPFVALFSTPCGCSCRIGSIQAHINDGQ